MKLANAAAVVALAMMLLVLAGCGGTSSSPPATTTPAATVPAHPTSTSLPGPITFGVTIRSGVLQGAGHSFDAPKQLAWVAKLRPHPSAHALTLTVKRTNGPGVHPRVVWTTAVPVTLGAPTLDRTLSSAELKGRQITVGGKFLVEYLQGATVLASGTVEIATKSGGSPGGY